jgi:NADH-quinone oxidoreductase subunit N
MFKFFLPEFFLIFSFIVFIFYDLFRTKTSFIRRQFQFNLNIVMVILIICVLIIIWTEQFTVTCFLGSFYKSPFINYVKLIVLSLGMFWVLLTKEIYLRRKLLVSLYPALFVVFILACFLTIMSLNLFVVFIGLEIQNILLFGFLSLNIQSNITYKQVFQFFLISAFFSGFMIFGLTLVYLSATTLDLIYLYHSLSYIRDDWIFLLGMFLFFGGFMFKLGLVPFSLWVPALFRNCPIMGLFIITIISKVIYFCLFITTLNILIYLFKVFFIFFSLWTLIVITPLAIKEETIRGLFGYSTIVQTAFMLLGLQLNTHNSLAATFFSLIIYCITMFVIFMCLVILEKRPYKLKIFEIINLKGLGSHQRLFSYIFTGAIFSLAGIPPFPGFFGKIFLLYSLIEGGDYFSSLLILIFTFFFMFYYVRIPIILFSNSYFKNRKIMGLEFNSLTLTIFSIFLVFNFWLIFNFYKLWILCNFLLSFY